jgi:hypothetical protein
MDAWMKMVAFFFFAFSLVAQHKENVMRPFLDKHIGIFIWKVHVF